MSKKYSMHEEPLKLYGVPLIDAKGAPRRLPDDVLKEVDSLKNLGLRTPGARLCFRTNSPIFKVSLTLKTINIDLGMSAFSCQSAHVLVGPRQNPRFAGVVNPSSYENLSFENSFRKSREMEDVTIFFPRNEQVLKMEIEIEDDALIEAPTPYNGKPIVYYGSSITEGGCCCNPFNAYNAVISNHLNVDYYNFGFAGSAKGELPIADFLNTLDMSIFVYDYDHNAPSVEWLKETHEAFFLRIREKHPTLPIIILTQPKEIYTEEDRRRKTMIRHTYEHAVAKGDCNVYFIDGETYFSEDERYRCFIDTVHPNDLGFARMAERIEPLIQSILNK